MVILDIDMDYFLNKIPYTNFNNNKRLDSKEYITWSKERFINFIENTLKLKKDGKIHGRIVVHHHEVFYYWRELIEKKAISYPFKLIHVDSHADLSYIPDSSWKYINENYLNKSYLEKTYPENLKDFYEYAKFDCGNYLLYTLACGWINKMDYVFHPELEELDFPHFLADKIDNKIILSIGNIENENLYQLHINPLSEEKLLINEKIDFITIAKSPQFTPVESDELVEILREYVILE